MCSVSHQIQLKSIDCAQPEGSGANVASAFLEVRGSMACSRYAAMATTARTTHACFLRLCLRPLSRSLARRAAHKRDTKTDRMSAAPLPPFLPFESCRFQLRNVDSWKATSPTCRRFHVFVNGFNGLLGPALKLDFGSATSMSRNSCRMGLQFGQFFCTNSPTLSACPQTSPLQWKDMGVQV